MRMVLALMAALAARPAFAQAITIALRDMGSFHIGGRLIEIKGQPIKEMCSRPAACPRRSTRTAPTRSSRCTRSTSWCRIERANCRC